jgi:hypothetical protein
MTTARLGRSCQRRDHAPAPQAPCQRKNPWRDHGACGRCGNTGSVLRDQAERSYGPVVGVPATHLRTGTSSGDKKGVSDPRSRTTLRQSQNGVVLAAGSAYVGLIRRTVQPVLSLMLQRRVNAHPEGHRTHTRMCASERNRSRQGQCHFTQAWVRIRNGGPASEVLRRRRRGTALPQSSGAPSRRASCSKPAGAQARPGARGQALRLQAAHRRAHRRGRRPARGGAAGARAPKWHNRPRATPATWRPRGCASATCATRPTSVIAARDQP